MRDAFRGRSRSAWVMCGLSSEPGTGYKLQVAPFLLLLVLVFERRWRKARTRRRTRTRTIWRTTRKAGLEPGLFDTFYYENQLNCHSMPRRRHAPCQPHMVWRTCIVNMHPVYPIHRAKPVTSTGDRQGRRKAGLAEKRPNPGGPEIRKPRPESERNSKSEGRKENGHSPDEFGFPSDFGFRSSDFGLPSDFGFRISDLAPRSKQPATRAPRTPRLSPCPRCARILQSGRGAANLET